MQAEMTGPERRPMVRRRRGRWSQVVSAAIAAVALLCAPLVGVTPAQASVSAGFDPSHIISDGNFYNGSALSAQEVQSFLGQRVSRCTLGDPGRIPGTAWGNTRLANNCLKDARFTTASRSANAYCKAYPGGTNETAGAIIAKVGQACGISQKVLLVMLEKEQSLISDSWPTVRQFDVAMGYACPDSGPNNSANCDPTQTGFFQQVYRAAWQLQVYKAFPNSYNYRPFRSNTIQWHPNAGCGTSQVTIQNWATAALYIYTPYRPNQAALDAGWGEGNSCSSYGNRNFYNFYSQWFGSPLIATDAKFTAFVQKNLAKTGQVTANSVSVPGGVRQITEKGSLYWSSSTGAAFLAGGIRTSYVNRGETLSSLGFPIELEAKNARGSEQRFSRGTIYWNNSLGALAVSTGIRTHLESRGGVGTFGYPTTEEKPLANGGSYQEFQQAVITWGGSSVGAQTIRAGLLQSYRNGQGLARYGYATSAEVGVTGGAWQPFQKADLHWRKDTESAVVSGGIRNAVHRLGGPQKTGLAINGESTLVAGVRAQDFQNVSLLWSASGSGVSVTNEVKAHFKKYGTAASGFPVGDTTTGKSGEQLQQTTRGTLVKSAGGREFVLVLGGIRNAFIKYGGVDVIGTPTAAEYRTSSGTSRQDFTNATVVWSSAGGGAVLKTELLNHYNTVGDTSFGAPMGVESAVAGGKSQEFVLGTVYMKTGLAPVLVKGGIRNGFVAAGGISTLGFPLSPESKQSDGSVVQLFERGKLVWTKSGGAKVHKGTVSASPNSIDSRLSGQERAADPEVAGTNDADQTDAPLSTDSGENLTLEPDPDETQ